MLMEAYRLRGLPKLVIVADIGESKTYGQSHRN